MNNLDNRALGNYLKSLYGNTQVKQVKDCPVCGSKLQKVTNRYKGIAYVTVWYCPKGHYTYEP